MPSTSDIIIDKADILFWQGGFEATSFADIAAAVGISRGNFYHHFKTKDDLLEAVITRRMDRTRAMLEGWQEGASSPRDRILDFIRIVIVNRAGIMAYCCPVGRLCAELAKLEHAVQDRAAGPESGGGGFQGQAAAPGLRRRARSVSSPAATVILASVGSPFSTSSVS